MKWQQLLSWAAAVSGVRGRGNAFAPSQIGIPSYFYPDCYRNVQCLWNQLDAGSPAVGLGIINPDSGPGQESNPDYVRQRAASGVRGVTILGYVHTSYGARRQTDVMGDIDKYYAWYSVDGIFLDEVPSADGSARSYYASLNQFIKSKGGQAVTVLNPGTRTDECFMEASDIIVTFEDTYARYLACALAGWERHYPARRFWHIVHTTPSEAHMLEAVRLSKSRNAGWIYVTPATMPNPYDTLPSGSYWTSELTAAIEPR